MIPPKLKLGQHYNFTVEYLINRDFYFKIPNFQRPLVWTQQQKIKLIESLWIGVPIGTYTVSESDNPALDRLLIDGQQRINAIKEYVNNEFKVYGLFYSEVTTEHTDRKFYNCQFPCYVTQSDDIDYLKNYYNIMNFGGTPHKESERAK
jgi:uncharacterized protein with ParB-like and HNH nuclease domain